MPPRTSDDNILSLLAVGYIKWNKKEESHFHFIQKIGSNSQLYKHENCLDLLDEYEFENGKLNVPKKNKYEELKNMGTQMALYTLHYNKRFFFVWLI